ncbi:hypothetical protein [Thioclava indica]|uniref:Uncharacterized protein n=1 Tax=Thioclava indica TaxID=1353528 RepID=A0A074JYR6_9RHOB|nr:hypothetical protein [Thioclava indica]KEO60698.1 hypothetical protein DT23_12715 [Thioclava indica]
MATIQGPVALSRSPQSSELELKFDIEFTEFEVEHNLTVYVKVVLYERDQSMDKIFFWTNGNWAQVHSVKNDSDRDEFITWFPSKRLRPEGRHSVSYHERIDLDNPELAEQFRRADDPLPDPPFLGSALWEELRAVVHVYNELSPSTVQSNEHTMTDVKP